MGVFVQLKHAKELPLETVGVVAKQRAKLQGSIAQPFMLVFTRELTDSLLPSGAKYQHPESVDQQIQLFEQLTQQLAKTHLAHSYLESFRECFELVLLDTSDLKSLSQLPQQRSVLGVIPSPSYEISNQQGQRIFLCTDDVEQGIQTVKSAIASFFTPQAIQYRIAQNIKEWSLGFIVFRLPSTSACIEVFRQEQGSDVASYAGLPSVRSGIAKDTYSIKGEIPQIIERNIVTQQEVCIFSLEDNQIVKKPFHSNSASMQSVPDYDILEASRLTKKAMNEWQEPAVHALYIKPKQGTLVLLDAYPFTRPKEVQQQSIQESVWQQKTSLATKLQDELLQLVSLVQQDVALQQVQVQIARVQELLNKLSQLHQ